LRKTERCKKCYFSTPTQAIETKFSKMTRNNASKLEFCKSEMADGRKNIETIGALATKFGRMTLRPNLNPVVNEKLKF